MTIENHSHFVSASLPYVNAAPHLGYAFELTLADVLVRVRRASGQDVSFVSGTDENSLKNVRAAEHAGVPPRTFVAAKARAFEELAQALDVRYDGFARTSRDEAHRLAVEHVFERCRARGDVYTRRYQGNYCVGCEQFYPARELSAGRCPIHLTDTEPVAEENHFFRLSRYTGQLLELLRSRRLRIVPEERHVEALRFAERGLDDFSISRSVERARGFGIPVPGDPSQVVYVWFDALVGYLSALGFPERASNFERYWSRSSTRLHVIGKDILRFHALYWPAILLSLGEALPTELLVHGFITVEGRKLSKALGHALDPFELVARYGSDTVRHHLAAHLSTTLDSDFAEANLVEGHDSELADELGNLVSRTLALVQRHFAGEVPLAGTPGESEIELRAASDRCLGEATRAFAGLDVQRGARASWQPIVLLNRYLDRTAPWQLARQGDRARLGTVLHEALFTLARIAQAIAPILPRASARLSVALGPAATPLGALFPKLRVRANTA